MNLGNQYGYRLVAATPSDGTNEPGGPFQGFHVGVAGNVVLDTAQGQQANATVTLAVLAGTFYPYRGRRINSTLTTATGIFLAYADRT